MLLADNRSELYSNSPWLTHITPTTTDLKKGDYVFFGALKRQSPESHYGFRRSTIPGLSRDLLARGLTPKNAKIQGFTRANSQNTQGTWRVMFSAMCANHPHNLRSGLRRSTQYLSPYHQSLTHPVDSTGCLV